MTVTQLTGSQVQELVKEIPYENRLSLDWARASNDEEVIVGIVCPSYSGSTLLTALLGSHSKIFGAGELHWLLSGDVEQAQKVIKKSEDLLQTNLIWRDLLQLHISYDKLYGSIFSRTDCQVIIDSSKRPQFFEKIVPFYPNKRFLFIYLLKHPMRLLAS